MTPAPRPSRLRLETVLLVGLLVAVGSLTGVRLLGGGGGSRSAGADAVWGNEAGLACLKGVVEAGAAAGPAAGPVDVAGVAGRVESIRGLRFEQVPEPEFLSPAELASRASDEVEYPEARARAEGAILAALGALDPGIDLAALLSQAVGEGVAGFYEPESGDLVVGGEDADGLDPIEEVILAHELTHALTDQALGLPSLELPGPGGEDAANAATALVEGDASLAESVYSASGGLLAAVSSIPALAAGPGLPELSYYLKRSFVFPYAEGLGFACRLYERGGWPAVDRAYDALPVSTAQILFPARYLAGEQPLVPADPAEPGQGWRRAARQSLGAADLLFLFEAPGDRPARALGRALERAGEWAGGRVYLWRRDGRSALTVALIDRDGGNQLCGSIRSWYRAAFPGDRPVPARAGEALAVDGRRQDASLRCRGSDVRLGIAPALELARRLAG